MTEKENAVGRPLLAMTEKSPRNDGKEGGHGGFPLPLFGFLIEIFRNDGHTGECFFFLLPPLRGRECPGSLPNQRFGRVGKGGGF